jgi:hypothetical protein
MKLSQLAVKLGLAANVTEAQITTALDEKVTLANQAAKVMPILAKWEGKIIKQEDVLELANAAVPHPQVDLTAGETCKAEKDLIATLKSQLSNPDKSGTPELVAKANERADAAEKRATTAETRAATADTAKAAAEGRAVKAETDLTLANAKVTLAETAKTTAETTLANIKGTVAKAAVSVALSKNQVLFSEQTSKVTELANSADLGAAVTTMLSGPPRLPIQTKVTHAAERSAGLHADPKAASHKFLSMVNERMEKEKVDYNTAYFQEKAAHPEMIAMMEAEASGQPPKTK